RCFPLVIDRVVNLGQLVEIRLNLLHNLFEIVDALKVAHRSPPRAFTPVTADILPSVYWCCLATNVALFFNPQLVRMREAPHFLRKQTPQLCDQFGVGELIEVKAGDVILEGAEPKLTNPVTDALTRILIHSPNPP